MSSQASSFLVIAGLALGFSFPVAGAPLPPASPLDPPGTVLALPDATLADAEQVFALADAAVYLPGEGVVRWHAADARSLEPRLAARTRTLRRQSLSAFVEEIDGELAPSARSAGKVFLAKRPSTRAPLEETRAALDAPAARLAALPFREGFEGGLSSWSRADSTNGAYAWGTTTCAARTGSRSADGVRGGTTSLSCSGTYPNQVVTQMTHSECEVFGGAGGWLDAYVHVATEIDFDTLGFYYERPDGTLWGYTFSGTFDAWFHLTFDLRQWYGVGDVTAGSCPRLMLDFSSDVDTNPGIGVRVDDLTVGTTPPPPVACSIQATPLEGAAPLAVSFDAVTTGASASAAYLWSFGDAAGTTSSQRSATFTYPTPGTYWVRLRLSDQGTRAYAYRQIRVTEGGPACTLACTASGPASAPAGVPVSFAASATATGCSSSPGYAWSFGDGGTSGQQSPSHAYAAPGTYAWSVTAAVDGRTCTRSGSITVTAPADPCAGAKPGDCDGNGKVTPAELQKAVNMYLGAAAACGVDGNQDGKVSLEELQRVANAALDVASVAGAGSVTVTPASVTLSPGGRQAFTATALLCGTPSGVTWSVTENGGGAVTSGGVYTAPATPGTYHVVATATANPSKKGTATVAVLGAPTTLVETNVGPSAADQVVEAPGKLAVVIPGGLLDASAKVAIQELPGVPAPPAPYSVRTPWFQVTVNGDAPVWPLPVVVRNGTSGTGEAFALRYVPPSYLKVPGVAGGAAARAGAPRGLVAALAGPNDLTIDYVNGPVAGAGADIGGPGQAEATHRTAHFEIHYYTKLPGTTPGPDAVPADADYAAAHRSDPSLPDFVEDVAAFLEEAYVVYTDPLCPLGLVLKPPSVKTIWIGAYDSSQWSWKTGRIYVANTNSGTAPVAWWASLRWELAHELFHAVQNQYRTFAGMYAVEWLTEGLADYAASLVTGGTEARTMLDTYATNAPDWLRYTWWTGDAGMNETMKYMSARYFDYVFRRGGLTPAKTFADFMANDYTAAYSSTGAAEHLQKTYGNFGSTWAEYVQFFYFDDASPLASAFGTGRSPRNVYGPKTANRLAYDDTTIGERELVLGAEGSLRPLTADYVALFPSEKSVVAKAGTPRIFRVEMLTALAEGETATLLLGKEGRVVDSEPMFPKGTARQLVLGEKEKYDSAYVLVTSTRNASESGSSHRVKVAAEDAASTIKRSVSFTDDTYKPIYFEVSGELTITSDADGGFTNRPELEIPESRLWWYELPPYDGTTPQKVRLTASVTVTPSGQQSGMRWEVAGYQFYVVDATRDGVSLPLQDDPTTEIVTRRDEGRLPGGGSVTASVVVRFFTGVGDWWLDYKIELADVAFSQRPQ